MSFDFFNTAPRIVSEKLMRITKSGRITELLEAVSDERAHRTGEGISRNGSVKVTRLGSFPSR